MPGRPTPWLLSERMCLYLEDLQRSDSRMICLLFTYLTQVCSFLVISSGRLPRLRTEHIKFPESESNDVSPNEKTTQPARKLSASSPTQEQPHHPAPSSSEAHNFLPLQDATPAASSGRPAPLQISDKRNPGPNGLQLSPLLTAQAERDQQIIQLTAKLAVKSALLEQSEANAAAAKDELRERSDQLLMQAARVKQSDMELRYIQTKLDEREKELANMRVKLAAKESELEAIRLRLMNAENDLIKRPGNREEDQVARRIMERLRAIEDEMALKRSNEKSIEDMECRNEG